jgi:hypothetical protein
MEPLVTQILTVPLLGLFVLMLVFADLIQTTQLATQQMTVLPMPFSAWMG